MSGRTAGTMAVVLAAGQGTRLRSYLPKVLHPVAGRPLLEWVLDAARSAGCPSIAVVVGHGAEAVREQMSDQDVQWLLQSEQRGTGHALLQARAAAEDVDLVLVLSGDVPLVSSGTLSRLIESARSGWGAMAVAHVEEPGSLGRVTASPEGRLSRIVEAADASETELAERRINAGIYALPVPAVFSYLAELRPDNAKGELYLTDALNAAAAEGHSIELVELDDVAESMGVNTRHDLVRVHSVLLERHARRLMDAGVTILDPSATVIEPSVEVGRDSTIHPRVALLGKTIIGEGCTIHQGSWLRNSTVGDRCRLHPYSILEGARVASACQIGPFTRLRPGAAVGDRAKVGNFVELKNAELGQGSKASHLSYLGDATIGPGSNIGAGVVICNYDGFDKHHTIVGRDAFIGSDTILIAPVEVGDEAMTAAGTVVTKNVPAGALAVARTPQRNLLGWMRRFRKRKKK